MTELRLVSNVETIPVGNLMDLPAQARDFADKLEAGEYGEVSRVLIVIDGSPLRFQYWGETGSTYELMGLLSSANMLLFADDGTED